MSSTEIPGLMKPLGMQVEELGAERRAGHQLGVGADLQEDAPFAGLVIEIESYGHQDLATGRVDSGVPSSYPT